MRTMPAEDKEPPDGGAAADLAAQVTALTAERDRLATEKAELNERLVRRQAESSELECPSCGKSHLKQELSTFAAHAAGPKASDAPVCPSGRATGNT